MSAIGAHVLSHETRGFFSDIEKKKKKLSFN